MSKVNKLFEIDEVELKENEIIVDIFLSGKEERVIIPRAQYEKWLSDSGRLEWVHDSVNYNGEYDQQTGTLSIENYWAADFEKRSDLYDWIVIKWVSEDVFNIQQPLANILGGHFLKALNEAV